MELMAYGVLGYEQLIGRIKSLKDCETDLTGEQIMALPPESRPSCLDRWRRDGYIIIDPPIDPVMMIQSQPGSLVSQSTIDVELGDAYRCHKLFGKPADVELSPIRLSDPNSIAAYEKNQTEIRSMADGVILKKGDFILSKTMRYYFLPVNLKANIQGRSKMARLGLSVHRTAPNILPGFAGQIVFEIVNDNYQPIQLMPCDLIAQLEFLPIFGDIGLMHSDQRRQSGDRQSHMKHALAASDSLQLRTASEFEPDCFEKAIWVRGLPWKDEEPL